MAARIHLQFATPRMRLARPISDANGRLVAGVGTMLSPGVVRVLRNMAVQSVLVEDAEGLAAWERVRSPEEEHTALAARFQHVVATAPLAELRAAIGRRIDRRAAAGGPPAAGDDAAAEA